MFKIALLTGGPSFERGISLNSARSVLDHLEDDNIEIIPIYFNQKKQAYRISTAQLYSNNPSDFDFKLTKEGKPLSKNSLVKILKSTDITFPVMHGPYGEDGKIQAFLERNKIPFIGSGSKACKMAFDKYKANKTISENGFHTLPSALLKIYDKNNKKIIKEFFKKYKVKRAIVKPATGGSSIGVFSVTSPEEALEKANLLFSKRMDTRVVLEIFAQGREFTAIILQNKLGMPVTLVPSEIETSYREGQIFDFRKKYLPTNQVKYHCPPNFSEEVIEKIRTQAEQLFTLFNMRDFARFDGWVLPSGEIWFPDFNPVPGMEQNSFLFQQSSRLGMSHRDLLYYVLKNSCQRQGVSVPSKVNSKTQKRKSVSVIFGGKTSERQVSLMSGTNVWLKLRQSEDYDPHPYLLDFNNNVWKLPYALILNHTVEEILESAKKSRSEFSKIERILKKVFDKLILEAKDVNAPFFLPEKMNFEDFTKRSRYVFLGLHGGDGENGIFQKVLKSTDVKFNGSDTKTSELCMDKYNTGEFIRSLGLAGVSSAKQRILSLAQIKTSDVEEVWEDLCRRFNAKSLIIKPRSDGCSTGIAHLGSHQDLRNYLRHLTKGDKFIPGGILSKHLSIIEMPNLKIKEILFENFIEVDSIKIRGNKLKYSRKTGWVEVTIGVIEKKNEIYALNPSVTLAEGEVLSLEEKFQGGTGVNLTPPPTEIVKPKAIKNARVFTKSLAVRVGISNYARIDAFMNVDTGELKIIEVNTLPALTPSTVIFHQALTEKPKIFPRQLLEIIIKNSGY